MDIDEAVKTAGLMQEAWMLIANAGWGGTEKPAGWQDSAARWKGDYQAWLIRQGDSSDG